MKYLIFVKLELVVGLYFDKDSNGTYNIYCFKSSNFSSDFR